ncbi:MAG: hypothetical protein EBU08_23465, partial [Micrococcales bacterium]|nr:hypothetical protein [Micrococcales bacterium]
LYQSTNWKEPHKDDHRDGKRIKEVTVELGYWRKHPDLHKYIVDTYAEGVDECQEISLTREHVQEIIKAVEDGALSHGVTGFSFGKSSAPGEANYYEQVVDDSKKWMDTLQFLSSLPSRSPQQEDELQKAQFWGPALRADINPSWNLMTQSWVPWRDYMVVFLQVTQKFFKDVPVVSINNYKFTCLCSVFLCYKLIFKAGFDENSIAWHCGWIDAFQALINSFDQARCTKMSDKDTRTQQDEIEQQCRERYRQSTYEMLEEEIQKHGFQEEYVISSLMEQIALFKELIARLERLVIRPQKEPPARDGDAMSSDLSAAPVDAMSSGEAGVVKTEDEDMTEDALQRARCQLR